MENQVEHHTFWRTMWLWPCFLLGTYNTIIYDQFSANVYETSSTLYCLPIIFMTYLQWDICAMLTHPKLYRTDLLIHHSMTSIIYCIGFYKNLFKSGSILMLCESISLLNYILRNHPLYLNYYRLLTIAFIRMPIWIGCFYFHFSHFDDMSIIPHITFKYGTSLFVVYDCFVIYKISKLLIKQD